VAHEGAGYVKLVLYGAVVAVVLLLVLYVWLGKRRRKRRNYPDVITPLLPHSQATLLGWRKEDGSIVSTRLVQHSEPSQEEVVVEFDPPLILRPGEAVDVHFWVPEGCKPVGNRWRAYSASKSFKN
jgi:hypothetical protein